MRILWLSFIFASSVSAQIARNFEAEQRPVYEIGAGMAGFELPDYAGSKNSQFRWFPFPYVIYRGEILRADDEGTRAKLNASKIFELGLSFGFNFPVESNQNAARMGMPDLDAVVGLGPQIMFRFFTDNQKHKLNLTFGLRAMASVNERVQSTQQGAVFEPSLAYWRYIGSKKTILFFSVESEFGDSRYNNYFYRVAEAFATTDREAYEAKAGLIKNSLIAGISHSFTPKLNTFIGAFHNDLNHAANAQSPLVETRHNNGFLVGLFWLFAESEETINIYK